MMSGITARGAHIPRPRPERSAIASAHQWVAPSMKGLAKGRREYCSWDEAVGAYLGVASVALIGLH
jgi:hypothetical protein